MNFVIELQKPQVQTQRQKVVNYLLLNAQHFNELMDVFLSQDYRLQQRSAWIVGRVSIERPEWLLPYYQQLIQLINHAGISDTFKRNVVRVWQEVEVPEQYLGEIYSCCFRFIMGKEAIAVKAFSMTICYNISNRIPELKPELLFAIEDVLRKDGLRSKGILSRGKKTLLLLKTDLMGT